MSVFTRAINENLENIRNRIIRIGKRILDLEIQYNDSKKGEIYSATRRKLEREVDDYLNVIKYTLDGVIIHSEFILENGERLKIKYLEDTELEPIKLYIQYVIKSKVIEEIIIKKEKIGLELPKKK